MAATRPRDPRGGEVDDLERLAQAIDARFAWASTMPLLPQAMLGLLAGHLDALDRLREAADFDRLCSKHPGLARFDALERSLDIDAVRGPARRGWAAWRRLTPEQAACSIDQRMAQVRRSGLLPQAIYRVMAEEAYVLEEIRQHPDFEDLCYQYPHLLDFAYIVESMAW